MGFQPSEDREVLDGATTADLATDCGPAWLCNKNLKGETEAPLLNPAFPLLPHCKQKEGGVWYGQDGVLPRPWHPEAQVCTPSSSAPGALSPVLLPELALSKGM